jgi:very-short-patch-repair endonuclease
MPHADVSGRQRTRAKTLRRVMTRAELLLWRALKAHHLDGLAFRRQTPMGPYIVDFICHAARLVIELDGESHDFEARRRSDQVRDRWLDSQGYMVLRFTNDDILSSLEGIVASIRRTANARIRNAPPFPALPRKGGGSSRKSRTTNRSNTR